MHPSHVTDTAALTANHVPVARRKRSPRRKTPDGRTWVVRRARELAAQYRSRLGAVADDPTVAAAVAKAAELSSIAESMRARVLRGEDVSADDLVRVQRIADLAVKRLGLPSAPAKASGPSLGAALRRLEAGL